MSDAPLRQVLLDTETTGLEADKGHRVIEIGCVELKNRRPTGNNYWSYFNPDREVDEGAYKVHGISTTFLADKPRFHERAQAIWDYLAGAEVLIHNASFDMGFLSREFKRCGIEAPLESVCKITDTVGMARKLFPGQKVSLDALCKRFEVDNSNRSFHGALLDAQLLAEVYLAMTGGQSRLTLHAAEGSAQNAGQGGALLARLQALAQARVPVTIAANAEELAAHAERLAYMVKKGKCLWAEPAAP